MFDRARRVLELQPDMRICDVEVFEAVASRSAPSDLSMPPPPPGWFVHITKPTEKLILPDKFSCMEVKSFQSRISHKFRVFAWTAVIRFSDE